MPLIHIIDRTIHTRGTGDMSDLRYKRCRCHRCNTIERNEPKFQFYVRKGDAFGPLFCENCLIAEYAQENAEGIKRIGENA